MTGGNYLAQRKKRTRVTECDQEESGVGFRFIIYNLHVLNTEWPLCVTGAAAVIVQFVSIM